MLFEDLDDVPTWTVDDEFDEVEDFEIPMPFRLMSDELGAGYAVT